MSQVMCNTVNKSDDVWNNSLAKLISFKFKHDHFNIPCKPDKSLYNWLLKQKKLYENDKLRQDRKECLLSIGVDMSVKKTFSDEEKLALSICPIKSIETSELDVKWNLSFAQLYLHWLEHGNTIPPKKNKTFSNWCATQRARFRKNELRHDRKSCLDQIDFDWVGLNDRWMSKFEELRAFKDEFGHCLVSTRSKDYPELALFVKHQRLNKIANDLGKEKIALLDSIGFTWVVGDMNERYYTDSEREEIAKGKKSLTQSRRLTPAQVLKVREMLMQNIHINTIMAETNIHDASRIKRIEQGITYTSIS